MKKIILLIFLLFLTGCTDYRELPDMAIISTVAIDYKDDEYNVIIQVLDSKETESTKSSSPSVILYYSSGKTLQEAFRNISLECPKKLYSGHIRAFIVKDNVFKSGASNFIDFVLRNHEIEKDFNLLITNEDINKIMNIIPPLEPIPSENIKTSIKNASKIQGSVNNIYFDKFLMNLYSIGIDPVLPSINIKKEDSINEEINPKERLALSKNLAIFKDDKFINYLSSDASLGFNILNNSATSSVITFKCDKNNYSSVELLNINSSFKFDVKTNEVKINLKLLATLSELNCNIDISKEEGINILKNMFTDRIKEIINKTIDEEKKYDVDYIGIEKYIYQNNYQFYTKNKDKIDNMIKNMDKDINVDITFTQKSSIRKGDEKY